MIVGVPHHLTQRGNNREPVFHTPEDRNAYLRILKGLADLHGTRILGYCLMGNHVHLIGIPQLGSSFAQTLRQAHSEYAARWNRREERCGHVWQGRYFSCPLDQQHLLTALRYVEQNPVRAGIVRQPWDWPWSSARAHTSAAASDAFLDSAWPEVLGRWDYREWRDMLHRDISCEEENWNDIRRATLTGEPLGSREFVSLLERIAGRRLRVLPRGRPRKVEADNAGVRRSILD